MAHGRPVRAEHDPKSLAEAVREAGEQLREAATDERLERLAEYGGPAQYADGETTYADETAFCEIATRVHEHARKRAPEILQTREPTRGGSA